MSPAVRRCGGAPLDHSEPSIPVGSRRNESPVTTEHQPGEWPVPRTPLPELKTEPDRDNHARARFGVILGALRAAFEEEPTPDLVRAASRRWITAALQTADEVIKTMQDMNKEGEK